MIDEFEAWIIDHRKDRQVWGGTGSVIEYRIAEAAYDEIIHLSNGVRRLRAELALAERTADELRAKLEAERARSERYREALNKFKAIEYNGERFDASAKRERACCVFCGRFHNEHSRRDDCPYSVVNTY